MNYAGGALSDAAAVEGVESLLRSSCPFAAC
jgi:hypothetical protein